MHSVRNAVSRWTRVPPVRMGGVLFVVMGAALLNTIRARTAPAARQHGLEHVTISGYWLLLNNIRLVMTYSSLDNGRCQNEPNMRVCIIRARNTVYVPVCIRARNAVQIIEGLRFENKGTRKRTIFTKLLYSSNCIISINSVFAMMGGYSGRRHTHPRYSDRRVPYLRAALALQALSRTPCCRTC